MAEVSMVALRASNTEGSGDWREQGGFVLYCFKKLENAHPSAPILCFACSCSMVCLMYIDPRHGICLLSAHPSAPTNEQAGNRSLKIEVFFFYSSLKNWTGKF